ncbi:MAG: EAL domain-containing protein [Oscillospiraceae bacterium]
MSSLKTVLVVDDHGINRTILSKILAEQYTVLEAENGQVAMELLHRHHTEIAAMMLDLVMPVMDGYAVLEALRSDDRYDKLPVVVTTGNGNPGSEKKALALGAWDFVTKPYDADIILFRLKNAIDRSQLSALKELKYLADYDALTGLYNKTKFFDATRKMLDASREKCFVFLRFDVDRFQLINSFFGTAEGDKLIIYIAQHMAEDAKKCSQATYGRIESDVVAICTPYEKEQVEEMVRGSKTLLAQFNRNYDIVPSIGMYVIDDPSISVEEMYNRATLAAKTCKGSYVNFFAYYEAGMSAALNAEQEITNEMTFALENGQFQIYLQPQYNIHTNLPCGAEALVRWVHPTKGLLSPGIFIPIFERNGFITKLDYYVWEQACRQLHSWKERGYTSYPISVNISRVNLYNPNLVEMLLELVTRYELEPALLNLELTESAYTDNPATMKKVMAQLQGHGFTVMMDDFGSGYSSLSLLKDIMIDVLKIDMQFLSVSEMPGRGENIIASVIRMAKWLGIPVIAEGAETREQVDFLRSVGCDYVQGYYYAKPMPIADYERLCSELGIGTQMLADQKPNQYRYDDLFSLDPEMKSLFSNTLQAAVIYEFADDKIEPIRVNEAYYALLGHEDMLAGTENILDFIEEEDRETVRKAFRACATMQMVVECDYQRRRSAGTLVWLHTKLHYISVVGGKHILVGELTDITLRREVDAELQKYKTAWLSDHESAHTILIVDDAAINRIVLKTILQGQFSFLEAENGEEAIRILRENPNTVDLILLDISMPVMDGKAFLKYKQNRPELCDIPVIMATADDSSQQQTDTFSLGANDYIVKPFVPAVVTHRVENVLESSRRFKEMVWAYNTMSEQVKTDSMTGLLNRASAEEQITGQLSVATGTCVMVMLDVDNFKQINDTRGHDFGDKVICAVAARLRSHFRKGDVVARMGGDEFAAFVCNLPDAEMVKKKARQLCAGMANIKIDGKAANITCSVGLAISTPGKTTFELLYHHADMALYSAKCRGRNALAIYGEELPAHAIATWLYDTESVLDGLSDSIYVCDKNTYTLIYANNSLCKLMGVAREDCKGKKCYEVLMHRTKPCEFCSMPTMERGTTYTRLYQMPTTAQVFLMRGENISRSGMEIHMEIAVDVTKVNGKNLRWSEVSGYEKE